MNKTLRIPNEPRFVRAFALAVGPGDALSLLLEIGAVGNRDLAIVRRVREALDPAYDWASERKDWEQAHTVSVLREVLAQPDAASYLAYHVEGATPDTRTATAFAESLAVIGCAVDSLTARRRPWEILTDDLYLAEWRERVRRLLLALPDNALPRPPVSTWDEDITSTILALPGAGRDPAQ